MFTHPSVGVHRYHPRVPLRVAIESIRPRQPDAATATALLPLLSALAPARPLHVLDLRWDAGPGTQAAPWTLAAIGSSAKHASLQVDWETLPLAPPRPGARLHGEVITTDLPGARRARSIPATWFGRHLCLVLPCAWQDPQSAKTRRGPIETGLRALDLHMGGPRNAPSARVAARMLATVFASVSVVIDGTWWAEISSEAQAPRRVLALDRCVALGIDHPSPAWTRLALDTLDPWLAHKLGLGGRGRGLEHAIRTSGDGQRATWPRASSTTSQPTSRLRGRVLQALWKPRREQARLGPAVPGELARAWHGWSNPEGPA